MKPKTNHEINHTDINSKSTTFHNNQSKLVTNSIKISAKANLREYSDKHSTNISDSINQRKGDFISNAEVNNRYLNRSKYQKTIEVHNQDKIISFTHSKSQMSPVKIQGVNINNSSTIKRTNRLCKINLHSTIIFFFIINKEIFKFYLQKYFINLKIQTKTFST